MNPSEAVALGAAHLAVERADEVAKLDVKAQLVTFGIELDRLRKTVEIAPSAGEIQALKDMYGGKLKALKTFLSEKLTKIERDVRMEASADATRIETALVEGEAKSNEELEALRDQAAALGEALEALRDDARRQHGVLDQRITADRQDVDAQLEEARAAEALAEDITVHVAGGTYEMTEPLRFDHRDGGRDGHRVVWQGPGTEGEARLLEQQTGAPPILLQTTIASSASDAFGIGCERQLRVRAPTAAEVGRTRAERAGRKLHGKAIREPWPSAHARRRLPVGRARRRWRRGRHRRRPRRRRLRRPLRRRRRLWNRRALRRRLARPATVSYTHLTLPTKA